MYNDIPTNSDLVVLALWVVLAIIGALLYFNRRTNQHDDTAVNNLDAWTRNYERTQRKH